jgi:hypothetical protein
MALPPLPPAKGAGSALGSYINLRWPDVKPEEGMLNVWPVENPSI